VEASIHGLYNTNIFKNKNKINNAKRKRIEQAYAKE
jgi:hypothetical protein